MTNSSDLHFLVILLLVVLFMEVVAGISTLIAVGVGVFSFLRRSARERVEGTNTPAAEGSRVGMKLGACAALLLSLLWLPEFIASGQPGFRLPGALAICILPSVAYGMLSGSMAGQCATRIGAVMVGATMFLLMQDPIGLCLLFNRLLANAGAVINGLPTVAFQGTAVFLQLCCGGIVGGLSHHLGHQRAAKLAAANPPDTVNRPAPVTRMSPSAAPVWTSLE